MRLIWDVYGQSSGLNMLWWSLTGLAVPTLTCCLSPVWWLDQASPTMTGWSLTTLTTCSSCLGNPSPHRRLMGTDTETCLDIWLLTGLTLPELGKKHSLYACATVWNFNSLRIILRHNWQLLSQVFLTYFYRDPNTGILRVPATWPEYAITGQQFLDINAKMDGSSIGQEMRLRFVRLWTSTLPSLQSHHVTEA